MHTDPVLHQLSHTVAKASDIVDYFVTGTSKVVNTDYIHTVFTPKDVLVKRFYKHMTTSLTCMPDTTSVWCLHLSSINMIGLM
jgi:hypothetical protein